MCEQRANSGTIVLGNYLYAFGGFQTMNYKQVGVRTFERLDLSKLPSAAWQMQEFSPDSIDLGQIACFYMSDITEYLRRNTSSND